MPASVVNIVVYVEEGASTIQSRYFPRGADQPAQQMQALLAAVASGTISGSVAAQLEQANGTRATRTIACTQANAANDTVTVAGVTLTEGTDFQRGANNNETAANLARAIRNKPGLRRVVDATDTTGTVTVTFRAPGTAGNALTITTSDATAFAIANGATGAAGTVVRGYRGRGA